VSPLYLYAVLGARPARPLGAGVLGEPLRLIDCGGVFAAAGEVGAAPPLAPDTLRGHDAIVRRLADVADAVLPARFGALATNDAQLCEQLTRAGEVLREALTRVAGREQMILRVYVERTGSRASRARSGVESADPPTDRAPERAGEAREPASSIGATYLAERARAQREAADVREIAPLRPVLDRFVSAERVERHDTRPLIASVYHLVARGTGAAYAAAVQDAAKGLPGVRVTVSGPWAPYAFAPDSLG
jgi:hypothetical protein